MSNNYNAMMACLKDPRFNESYAEAEIYMQGYILYRVDRLAGRKKRNLLIYLREQFAMGT